jgi:hypothetical protein
MVGRVGPLWPMLAGLLLAAAATLGLLRLQAHTSIAAMSPRPGKAESNGPLTRCPRLVRSRARRRAALGLSLVGGRGCRLQAEVLRQTPLGPTRGALVAPPATDVCWLSGGAFAQIESERDGSRA